jgi:hypothetical protein
MNLLTIIISISAFVYSIAVPINNHNTTTIKNITTSIPSMIFTEKNTKTIKCYHGYSLIDTTGEVIPIVSRTLPRRIETCSPDITGCRMYISWDDYIYDTTYITLFVGCAYDYSKKRKFPNKSWCLHLRDYDNYDKTDNLQCSIIEDYCEGNLCNSLDLKNLPYIKKLLSIQPKSPQQHDALCPGYSKNYRKIIMEFERPKKISVVEGSNLILVAKTIQFLSFANYLITPQILPNSNSSYDKTEWTVATLENPSKDMPFISFDQNDNVITYDISHDLIDKNKIFYLTPKSIHICNFTKEDQGIFKHIDKLQNNQTLVYALKITTATVDTIESSINGEYVNLSSYYLDSNGIKDESMNYFIIYNTIFPVLFTSIVGMSFYIYIWQLRVLDYRK